MSTTWLPVVWIVWMVMTNTLVNVQVYLEKGSKNTLRALSPIHDHCNTTGHTTTTDTFSK